MESPVVQYESSEISFDDELNLDNSRRLEYDTRIAKMRVREYPMLKGLPRTGPSL
jgi:hypothetical protein